MSKIESYRVPAGPTGGIHDIFAIVNLRSKWIVSTLISLVALYTAFEILANWDELKNINLIAITGFGTGLLFLWHSHGIKVRFESLFDQVINDGVVYFWRDFKNPDSAHSTQGLERQVQLREGAKEDLERRAHWWGLAVGLALALLSLMWFLGVLFPISDSLADRVAFATAILIVPMLVFVCGLRLGRMACYGWRGTRYRSYMFEGHGVALNPQIGHPDGLCGLSVIGAFYLSLIWQMLIPLAYCLAWSWLLHTGQPPAYLMNSFEGVLREMNAPAWSSSIGPLLSGFSPVNSVQLAIDGALAVTIALQFLGFFAPMWIMHRELKSIKKDKQVEVRKERETIERLENSLKQASGSERSEIMAQIVFHRGLCRETWNMPVWPASFGVLGQFLSQQVISITLAWTPLSGVVNDAIEALSSNTPT